MQSRAMGDALAHTFLLYALSETIALLATPLAMHYMRGSMIRGLVFGTAFLALAYAYVGALALGIFPHGAAIIGILLGLYRALYRVPYAVELQQTNEERGAPHIFRELLLAAMPALAGSLITFGLPFASLMSIAAILSLIALTFLPFVANAQESYSWTYRGTFAHFLHERNARLVSSAMVAGVRNVALVLFWPLALVVIIGVRSSGLLGALVSAMLMISVLYGSGRGYRALEHTIDSGAYIDEYTTLKEMGRSFGAICACGVAALLAVLF